MSTPEVRPEPAGGPAPAGEDAPAEVVARIVDRLRAGEDRLGPVRLVVVDGPAGSGKTTLAAALGAALPAQVLHLDDLYEGWQGLEGSWERLAEWVLRPLAAGRAGRYRRYDWARGAFAEWHQVPVAPYLVVEGCGAGRQAADEFATLRIWVEADDETRLRRGLARDGEPLRPQWEEWMRTEPEHFARNRTRERADLHLDGFGRLVPSPAPARAPAAAARPAPVPAPPRSAVPARDWYDRPVLGVARDLLGALVTTRSPEGEVTVRLTEVEAYDGANDPGSHAFRGRTERNRAMFGEPGRLYVYRHLGLHHCVNIVCGPPGRAAAVLMRAGEVVSGADLARRRRLAAGVVRADRDLARGPARLAVALGLDLAAYGADVTDPAGDVVVGLPAPEPDAGNPTGVALGPPAPGGRAVGLNGRLIAAGPRVGVAGDGGRVDRYPWRFTLAGDPTVSAYRAAPPAGSRRASR